MAKKWTRNFFHSSRIDGIAPYCQSNGEVLPEKRGRECQFTRPDLSFHGRRKEGEEERRMEWWRLLRLKYRLLKRAFSSADSDRAAIFHVGSFLQHAKWEMWHKKVHFPQYLVVQSGLMKWREFQFHSHRFPISSPRSGAVANAKIACHLVSANKVSGAIGGRRDRTLCSKSLRPHAGSSRIDGGSWFRGDVTCKDRAMAWIAKGRRWKSQSLMRWGRAIKHYALSFDRSSEISYKFDLIHWILQHTIV